MTIFHPTASPITPHTDAASPRSRDDAVAVIIPFFQRKTGILAKAVCSALAQANTGPVTVFIIDDESPVSAKEELAEIILLNPGSIVIVEQPNGGPAAARNRGLDEVPLETPYVAFLDSDDEWTGSHLSNALDALALGNDFYFSDHFQLNQSVSAFNRAQRIEVGQHPQIGNAEHLRKYAGDMFDQILTGNIIGTSTVVYRFAKFPRLRFREEFVYAGEDYLFWLELSALSDKIVFSSLCECTYGAGVNIFAGSGWGTEKSLTRLHYEMKYKRALPKLFRLNESQLKTNEISVRNLRRSFVTDVLHRLKNRTPIEWKLLRGQFAVDPLSLLCFVPLAAAIILQRRTFRSA